MASNLMMALWQSNDALGGNSRVLLILLILIAGVIVAQAIVIIAAARAAMKTQRKLSEVADELKASAVPFLTEARAVFAKSSELIDDVGPSIRKLSRNAETATENIVAASETFKHKVVELDELLTEVQGRTRSQVRRVDGIVTGALDATAHITSSIQHAIMIPVREIGAVMNGVKAGIDSLMGRAQKFGVYSGGRQTEDDSELGL